MEVVLTKPVVSVQRDTQIAGTLPIGAEVEFSHNRNKNGFLDVDCRGRCFSVFFEDLLDACTVGDAVRVSFF